MAHPNVGQAAASNTADEERRGLLLNMDATDQDHDQEQSVTDQPRGSLLLSKNKLAVIAGILATIILGGTIVKVVWSASQPSSGSRDDVLFSNGTHNFKRTVILVSIDGLRADYLDRGLTPHLLDISKKGIRAKYMKPIFPTLTFPNHWSLMTGLYAESHGIVGNNFYDHEVDSEFWYNNIDSCWNASWWFGQPMWETAERSGITTANLMWPGPPRTIAGFSSSFYVPWKDHVTLQQKHDQIMEWVDLPQQDRPQLILAYEPSLDQAGHAAGPVSALVDQTLSEVDLFAKNLTLSLAARNLTDIVDIIFVSDHGMTDTSHPEFLFIDEILGEERYRQIEHEDGWPSMGLHLAPEANVSEFLDILSKVSAANPGKFDVFTPETMPERYHFSKSHRIAPIYAIPKIGYGLTNRAEGGSGMSKGNHGYDNDEPSMYAAFVAHGPFSTTAKSKRNIRFLDGWHSVSPEASVMNGFNNVELYNLVMKLLNVEKTAPNNGTAGFWDRYL